MTKYLSLVAMAALLIVAVADAETLVYVYSLQDSSCGWWSSRRGDGNTRSVVAFWSRGFISGYNWFNQSNQVRRDLSDDTIVACIDKYCRDNPSKNIEAATISLICETNDGRGKPFLFCEPKGK